jgi:hypothetical protein
VSSGKKDVDATVDLDDRELYRAIQRAAAERGEDVDQTAAEALREWLERHVEHVVVEALREWLERQEEKDDLAAIAEAETDPTYPWEQVRAEMREARAAQRAR